MLPEVVAVVLEQVVPVSTESPSLLCSKVVSKRLVVELCEAKIGSPERLAQHGRSRWRAGGENKKDAPGLEVLATLMILPEFDPSSTEEPFSSERHDCRVPDAL